MSLNGNESILLKSEWEKNKPYYNCIAFGGSLGGPQALCSIFSKLPKDIPVPIFVVQHISPGFSKILVEWLQKGTELKVCISEDNQIAHPGTAYLAPDNCHMLVDSKNRIHLERNLGENSLQPSVGRLFQSVAQSHGAKGIGVILTGMGRDGARELGLIKEKGGATIAQNQESSVVFGMPYEAQKIDAAKYILSLDDIPIQLIKLLRKKIL